VEQPTKSPLNCSICDKPVAFEIAKTDDSGQVVHEECYALRLGSSPHSSGRVEGSNRLFEPAQTGRSSASGTRRWWARLCVDCQTEKIVASAAQQFRYIDDIDRSGERRHRDFEGDPSCATTIQSSDKHGRRLRKEVKIELLQSALEHEECPEEFFTMRATAERRPKDVVFGTFHVWAQNDAN
jgi:hypothetical protein